MLTLLRKGVLVVVWGGGGGLLVGQRGGVCFFPSFHYTASISITQSKLSDKIYIFMLNACPAHWTSRKKMLGTLNDYNLSRKFYGGWRLGSPTLKQM